MKGSDAPQIYHITADIDRVETSITIAGRRIAVRAAALLIIGLLGSFALASLLLPPLGPLFAVPIGLTPLYLAALLAFVRTPDGRHWEAMIVDRYRFSRMAKLAVNTYVTMKISYANALKGAVISCRASANRRSARSLFVLLIHSPRLPSI